MAVKPSEMSAKALWAFREEVSAELTRKVMLELARLDDRLRKINPDRTFRPLPKYHNPKNPKELWSGRGRRPRWLATELRSGKVLDDFLIDRRQRTTAPGHPRRRFARW